MIKNPKISIVMSVFNQERYLQESIESILNQTINNFEFIIINDGSTDRTKEILESYTDSRIILINNKNIGLAKSLNIGINIAKGEYIARMDADDISLQDRLADQIEFMESNPQVGLLGTAFQAINVDGEVLWSRYYPSLNGILKWLLFFYSPFCHPSVVIKKKMLLEVGGYNPHLLTAQDYDLWQKLSCITKFANLYKILLQYRVHDKSTSKRYQEKQKKNALVSQNDWISNYLNESISLEQTKLINGYVLKTKGNPLKYNELLISLYKSYISKEKGLTLFENKYIKKDTALKLFQTSKNHAKNIKAWRYILYACALDPRLTLRIFKSPIARVKEKIKLCLVG